MLIDLIPVLFIGFVCYVLVIAIIIEQRTYYSFLESLALSINYCTLFGVCILIGYSLPI